MQNENRVSDAVREVDFLYQAEFLAAERWRRIGQQQLFDQHIEGLLNTPEPT